MTSRMTLQDVADLAHVQRPVVTMWRKRGATGGPSFPTGHREADGQERFEVQDVVDYLEATGRGNNPFARADAAAYAMWSGTAAEREATARTLSALLTLRKLAGPLQQLDADDILDLADDADPDDDCLFGEIEASGDLARDAATAEALVEAAWDVQRAHARIIEDRFRAGWRPLAEAAVSPLARLLMRALTVALARDLGEGCPVADPTGCAADLLVEAVDGTEHPVVLVRGEGEVARLTQRMLILSGHRYTLVTPEIFATTSGPLVHLLALPAADDPDPSPDQLWDAIDELDLRLGPGQRAVVLAPAALLTDPLTDGQEARRDQVLRSGRVRTAVRLPAALRISRPREHLAVWVLADPDTDTLSERRTGVADLSDLALDAALVTGLVDDVLACLHGIEAARRRSWAHLAWLPTADLVARRGALVAGIRHRPSPPRGATDRVLELRVAVESAGLADRIRVEPVPDEVRARTVTLGTAVDRGHLRHLPGQRLDLAGVPDGQLPVATPTPDTAGWTVRHVDRLTLALGRDLRLTEPGDVVVTVRPAPDAWVDERGGTLVLTPGFVLRPRPGAGFGSYAIAEAIRSQPAGRTRWRDWTVGHLPPDSRQDLEAALATVAAEREALRRRLDDLDRAARLLTETVGSGQARPTTPASDHPASVLPPIPNEGA